MTIQDGIPDDDYRAWPALSSTGAKTLLQSPAKYRYQQDHPRPPRPEFDLGHVVHTGILGIGKPIVVIDAPDWRTKAAKEAAEAARADGSVPLLRKDADIAQAMIDAVHDHPLAAAILAEGKPEQSFTWVDEATGVTCKGRTDWLRDNAIVDLKTCADASPDGFGRAAANLSYDLQAEFYRVGVEQATGERLPFLHLCVEKEGPYSVAVHQLPPEADERGARLYRQALDLYAKCIATDEWPAYGDDILTPTWPKWAA